MNVKMSEGTFCRIVVHINGVISFCHLRHFYIFQVFPGNSDPDTIVTNMFECPIITRCVRLNPISWKNFISLRFDIIGCSTY